MKNLKKIGPQTITLLTVKNPNSEKSYMTKCQKVCKESGQKGLNFF